METTETPREFAESMAQKMKHLIESGEDVIPIAIAHTKSGPDLLIGFEFKNEHSKDLSALAMQVMAKMTDVEYVVFLSDTWVAQIKPESGVDVEDVISQGVRNYPERKEAIAATIFGRNRMTEVGTWSYERINGKVVFTDKMQWYEPDSCEGRFVPPAPIQQKTKTVQ